MGTILQDKACHEVTSKKWRCRECVGGAASEDVCRFVAFRRLKPAVRGKMCPAGFAHSSESTEEELMLWMPRPGTQQPSELEVNMARLVLEELGEQFVNLFEDEFSALDDSVTQGKSMGWKRVVEGIREMCDVCDTTLFNVHWVCGNCGFVACIDCHRDCGNDAVPRKVVPGGWLPCKNGRPHDRDALLPVQIIPEAAFRYVHQKVGEVGNLQTPNYCAENFIQAETLRGLANLGRRWQEWLTNVARDAEEDDTQNCNSWALLGTTADNSSSLGASPGTSPGTLDDVISSGLVHTNSNGGVRRLLRPCRGNPYSIQVMNLGLCKTAYPDVPHYWLCDGRLLLLEDPEHPGNSDIFHDQWARGQPVLISKVHRKLDAAIWSPESFASDFGERKVDFLNCVTEKIVPRQAMRNFWNGFHNMSRRMTDATGFPMLLKVKDWPPGEDFAALLPTRFEDLMNALPMPEYTRRSGKLNLVSHLPECFVRPDLGPKMYSAYGSVSSCQKATTNLHLDMSDAVNLMVYVGITEDADKDEQTEEVLLALEEAGCDVLTKRRVLVHGETPGALWHIYHAQDADKIRDLLNRVSVENELGLQPNNDPIHDQNRFLDSKLRARLYEEYGVQGYAILQCLGDAVFIPAGAPHQVRNLHNCIKVAEDFVSPENIAQCFELTQEFRKLTKLHQNHEDKLQIKNIIYHSVKEAVGTLSTLPA